MPGIHELSPPAMSLFGPGKKCVELGAAFGVSAADAVGLAQAKAQGGADTVFVSLAAGLSAGVEGLVE